MKSYFTDDELKCRCCGKVSMDPVFMDILNRARQLAGHGFVIDSGYRCMKHNAEVGSTSTNHTSGKAVDISCEISSTRFTMIEALIRMGMLGIGIAPTFIHADINRTLPAIWLY